MAKLIQTKLVFLDLEEEIDIIGDAIIQREKARKVLEQIKERRQQNDLVRKTDFR